MSQSEVVDHQSTGSREESAIHATTKVCPDEPYAVTLAIDLTKDVFELTFAEIIGMNDDPKNTHHKVKYTNATASALSELKPKASAGENRKLKIP